MDRTRCFMKCKAFQLSDRCDSKLNEHCRFGVTMIEIMVVISIIAVMAAFLLPAIQQMRESSRKMDCSSRLRQIGIAVHNYHSVFDGIPISISTNGKSPLRCLDGFLSGAGALSTQSGGVMMQCPSDRSTPYGESYAINAGTVVSVDSFRVSMNGCWAVDGDPVRFSALTDGLSNTAMFAEWLRGNHDWFPGWLTPLPPPNRSEVRRLIVAVVMPLGSPMTMPAAMSQCAITDPKVAPVFSTSRGYGSGGMAEETAYFHELPPNANSCFIAPPILGIGVNCPSSFHRDGANVLFADGSVHYTSSQVDNRIWKALGTRAGNEQSTH